MAHIRWLDDHEQRAWRAFLAANRLFMDYLERQLQQDAGIPLSYYEILVRLSEVPGRTLRMSELAEHSMSSRSRISHAVARLEENGWVRRRECDTDRRGLLCELTEAGLGALRAAAPGHVSAVRTGLFDLLTPSQVAAMGEICETVADHFGGDRFWPPRELDAHVQHRSEDSD